MLKKLVDAVIGTRHERDVKKLRPIVEQIHEHEARLGELDDAAIQAQTARFRGVLAEKAGALGEEVARLREARRTELDAAERHRLEEELPGRGGVEGVHGAGRQNGWHVAAARQAPQPDGQAGGR